MEEDISLELCAMSNSLRFFLMKTVFVLVGIAILSTASAMPLRDVPARENEAPNQSVSDTLTLREVTVKANFSPVTRSPMRLSVIDNETIRERAGSRT